MKTLLSVSDISKSYDDLVVVKRCSFEFEKGDVVGFFGPNGAGKTTIMRMISGYLSLDSGKVVINGFDMEQNPIKAKKHIGYVPEGSPLHDELRTIDFLKYCAQVKGVKNIKSTIQNIAIKLQIQDKLYVKIATLSKGYKRRVSIAQALLSNPAILILDEPTDGLDPNQKQVIRELINEIKAEKTIIIATHLLEEADEICNKIIIMDKSKIKLQSSMNEIRKQDKTLVQIFKSLTNNKNDEVNQ